MAAQKLVAVFLMCLVLAAAMHVTVAEDLIENDYKKCLSDCEDKCIKENKGYTFCEMKCDSDCGTQEFKANLEKLIRS